MLSYPDNAACGSASDAPEYNSTLRTSAEPESVTRTVTVTYPDAPPPRDGDDYVGPSDPPIPMGSEAGDPFTNDAYDPDDSDSTTCRIVTGGATPGSGFVNTTDQNEAGGSDGQYDVVCE